LLKGDVVEKNLRTTDLASAESDLNNHKTYH